jgi:hypothetical protein
MVKIAAMTAASFGLALTAQAQTQQMQPQQAQQMCEDIWESADTQNQGFVTGQQAQRLQQAMQTAQGRTGTGAGGAPQKQTEQRVTRQEFMSACQRSPQSFQHLRS